MRGNPVGDGILVKRGWTARRTAGGMALLVLGVFAVVTVETWRNRIAPSGITLHHTGLPFPCDLPSTVRVDAALIDRFHQRRGYGVRYLGRAYHISYHYLILPDGTIQRGRPERCIGAHTLSHNDTLGICLVGYFDGQDCRSAAAQPRSPTAPQMTALVQLSGDLLRKYRLPVSSIRLHSEYGSDTECPGSSFPKVELLKRLPAVTDLHTY